MDDLSLVPTQDLIDELMGRTTFAGIILYSPNNHRNDDQVHDDFHLLTATTNEDTIHLLERAAEIVREA